MPKVPLHRHLTGLIASVLLLSIISAAQDPKSADEEQAVRNVAEQYFAAFMSKEAAKPMSFWSTKSPDLVSRREQMQELFARIDKIEIRNLEVRSTAIDGDKAVTRVAVEILGVETKTGKPAPELGRVNRTLHLVKESGAWKIQNEVPAEDELAAALINAKSAAEREDLLAADKELMTVNLRKALISRGNDLANRRALSPALDVFRLALRVAETIDDKAGVVRASYGIGRILKDQNDNGQALEYFEKTLALSEASDDKEMIARVLNNIGVVYRVQGKTDQALGFFERSLNLAKQIGNRQAIANALQNIGNTYASQGNYSLAIEHQRLALAENEIIGNKLEISRGLNNIGNLQATLGNLAEAQASYIKSLELSQPLGNKELIGMTLYNLGNVHRIRGNYIQALEYYTKSLEAGGGFGVPINIGGLYEVQGDYAQALSYYRKALAMIPPDDAYGRAVALTSIGDVHRLQGNYPQALEYYKSALTAPGHARRVQTWTGIGSTYLLQHNYADALKYLLESLKVAEEIGEKGSSLSILLEIAKIHIAQRRYPEALEFAARSAEIAKQTGYVGHLWEAHAVAGQTHRALDQPEKARRSFEEAIATIEAARLQVAGGEEEQQRFMEAKILPYQEMIELLVAEGKTNDALSFAERSKGRVLLDVLQSGRINLTKAMTARESEEERRLNNELVSVNSQIANESRGPQPDQKRLADLRSKLEKTRLDYQAFRTSLYATHPNLKVQRGEVQPISLESAFGLLPDGKSALVEYVVSQNRTFLFVLTKNDEPTRQQPTLKVYPIEIKERVLEEQVERYRQKVAKGDLDFRAPGRELYDLLLKPAQDQLRGKTLLVLIPDGVLWDLPFQALQSPAQQYVVEEHAILYAPSLTVLREMIRPRRKPVSSTSSATLLAFGNPVVGKQTEQRVKAVFMDEKLEPLPEAEKQVAALAQLYGAKQSRVYTGAEAREDRAKVEAPAFRILQFATHGILNSTSPMYSNLMLSPKVGDSSEDGLLEAWEIMDLDLNADMVVLAACETARGRVGAGEGMIGMSWAFFVAGSPTTVASQWKVESASTTELMLEFHRNLKSRTQSPEAQISKARALQLASLKLLKSRQYQHPFYWAGFVLIGDGF